MEKYDQIKKRVIQLCNLHNCNNKETIDNCLRMIDEYLSYEGSSLETLFDCFDSGIINNSWLLPWKRIVEETEKLSGEFYIEQEKSRIEKERILLNYEPLNLGEKVLSNTELEKLKINVGVIDALGTFHTSERAEVPYYKWPDHRQLADYLHTQNKIEQYYIRVGCIIGENLGLLSAESLYYGVESSLKKFLLTEKMAIALYNSIMSKKNRKLSTFEEKLAFYGTEYGYYTTQFRLVPQIYDYELYSKNMKVLSRTLGKRFNEKYLTDILNN